MSQQSKTLISQTLKEMASELAEASEKVIDPSVPLSQEVHTATFEQVMMKIKVRKTLASAPSAWDKLKKARIG